MTSDLNLLLKRDSFNDRFTLGKLFVDGHYYCETLEDTDRNLESGGVKIPRETAIPRGRYLLVVSMSSRFGRPMIEVKNVREFSGVRIHGANTADDVEGCIGVGNVRTQNGIAQCAGVVRNLTKLVGSYIGNVWLTVE